MSEDEKFNPEEEYLKELRSTFKSFMEGFRNDRKIHQTELSVRLAESIIDTEKHLMKETYEKLHKIFISLSKVYEENPKEFKSCLFEIVSFTKQMAEFDVSTLEFSWDDKKE